MITDTHDETKDSEDTTVAENDIPADSQEAIAELLRGAFQAGQNAFRRFLRRSAKKLF